MAEQCRKWGVRMAEYQAIYKCRLCGEKFVHCETGDLTAMALTVALATTGKTEHVRCNGNLHRHIPHNCKDGSYGMADFQGFQKVKEENA